MHSGQRQAPKGDSKVTEEPPDRLVFDSATIYELVSLFSLTDKAYGWARSGAEALTAAFLSPSRIEIAGAPTPTGPASALYGELTNCMHGRLQSRLVAPHLQVAIDVDALFVETRAWVAANAESIASAYVSLRSDPNFHPWLEFAKRTAWIEHSGRLGGLYDSSFLPQIDAVLKNVDQGHDYGRNVPNQQDLESLLPLSRDLRLLPGGDLDQSTDVIAAFEHGYIVSALIRGYFHQQVATRRKNVQLTRHPFREGVFARVRESEVGKHPSEERYEITNTQKYLSQIIVADALKEASAERRGFRWIKNVENAIDAVDSSLELEQEDDDNRAYSKAVSQARKLGLVTDKKIDTYVAGTHALLAGLSAFTLVPFLPASTPHTELVSSLAGIAASAVSPIVNINGRVSEAVKQALAKRQLKELRLGRSGVVSYSDYRLPITSGVICAKVS